MKDKHKLLRSASLVEGTSFLLLMFVAMPLKYFADMPIWVRTVGPIHGVLFILFIVVILLSYLKQKINLVQLLVGLVASVLPLGTFIFTSKMLKREAP